LDRGAQEHTGGGGGPGASNRRRPGAPGVRPGRGIERGDRCGRVEVLTGVGDDGEQAQSCRRRRARRPARAPMDGNAPANLRPRGGAEEVQLDEAKLQVGSATPVGHPRRRTRRRRRWPAPAAAQMGRRARAAARRTRAQRGGAARLGLGLGRGARPRRLL
jgi:hypothetical protein